MIQTSILSIPERFTIIFLDTKDTGVPLHLKDLCTSTFEAKVFQERLRNVWSGPLLGHFMLQKADFQVPIIFSAQKPTNTSTTASVEVWTFL